MHINVNKPIKDDLGNIYLSFYASGSRITTMTKRQSNFRNKETKKRGALAQVNKMNGIANSNQEYFCIFIYCTIIIYGASPIPSTTSGAYVSDGV